MKRISTLLLLSAMTAGFSGCTSMHDGMISCEMGIRNHVLAQKAWGHWSWCYNDLDYPFHFAKGFKAGYQDILNGGAGCQPTLPPQCYWKPHYQNPEGLCKINAWFDGFSHGVLAAKQDGYGHLGQIPISPTARQNLQLNQTPRPDDMFYADGYAEETAPHDMSEDGVVEPPIPGDGEILPAPAKPGVQLTPVRPYE